jgi:hypothetical protein
VAVLLMEREKVHEFGVFGLHWYALDRPLRLLYLSLSLDSGSTRACRGTTSTDTCTINDIRFVNFL